MIGVLHIAGRRATVCLLVLVAVTGHAQPLPAVTEEAQLFTRLPGIGSAGANSGYGSAAALLDLPESGPGNALAFVGANLADASNGPGGAVVVYLRTSDGAWTEEAILLPSEGSRLDARFGSAIAAAALPDGRVLALVGARQHSPIGQPTGSRGAVYAFERDPTTRAWAETARLDGPFVGPTDEFGRSLALDVLDDGTPDGLPRALVSAPAHRVDGGTGYGAAFVFELRDDGTWALRSELSPPPIPGDPGTGNERVGWHVALKGDHALVGAATAVRDGLFSTGTVYAFTRDAATSRWITEPQPAPPVRSEGAQFGYSVALAEVGGEPLALVGEPNVQGGYVHVYRRAGPVGDEWVYDRAVTPTDVEGRGQFGWWVAAAERPDGAALVVGTARTASLDATLFTGSATAFVVRAPVDGVPGNPTWEEVARVRPEAPQQVQYFGGTANFSLGVAPSGLALVGSPGYRRGEEEPEGVAYAFGLRPVLPVASSGFPPSAAARLAVWPNPSRGRIASGARVSLRVERPAHVRVVVADALGREVAVLHEGVLAGEGAWALPGLSAGVYVVRASGPWGSVATRATVLR